MPTRFAQSFDPELAATIREAFNLALESAKTSVPADELEWARETVALRIIDTALGGENNVDRLRDDALAFLANAKMKKRA